MIERIAPVVMKSIMETGEERVLDANEKTRGISIEDRRNKMEESLKRYGGGNAAVNFKSPLTSSNSNLPMRPNRALPPVPTPRPIALEQQSGGGITAEDLNVVLGEEFELKDASDFISNNYESALDYSNNSNSEDEVKSDNKEKDVNAFQDFMKNYLFCCYCCCFGVKKENGS